MLASIAQNLLYNAGNSDVSQQQWSVCVFFRCCSQPLVQFFCFEQRTARRCGGDGTILFVMKCLWKHWWCDREVSGVSQELCMPALSAGGPGEHSVGWRLESELYCAPATARSQCPVGSWALEGPGCLLECSGFSLKHSSDVQRRRQLKLQAFPTMN